jgi:hypothetical protein
LALLVWTVEIKKVHDEPDRRYGILVVGPGREFRPQPGHPVGHYLTKENVLFGREVPEERTDRDIGGFRDVLDRRLLVAPLAEKAQRGLLERLSRLQLLAFAPRRRLVDAHRRHILTQMPRILASAPSLCAAEPLPLIHGPSPGRVAPRHTGQPGHCGGRGTHRLRPAIRR